MYPHTVSPLLAAGTTTGNLSKPRNQRQYVTTPQTSLYLNFTCFSAYAPFLSRDPMRDSRGLQAPATPCGTHVAFRRYSPCSALPTLLFCPRTPCGTHGTFSHHLPCSVSFCFFKILRVLRCNGQVFIERSPSLGLFGVFSQFAWGHGLGVRAPQGSTLSSRIWGHETCVVSLGMLT